MNSKENNQKQNDLSYEEMYYDTDELKTLKYVKVVYTDSNGELQEVTTEVKFIGDLLISLYFNWYDFFEIETPQDVMLKFVTTEAMYIATAKLHEIKKTDDKVYFSVVPPKTMIRNQNRKYCRVPIERSCVLVVDDNQGKTSTYMTKSVNLSASGILINNIKTIVNDKSYTSDFSKFDCFHIVICLEADLVFKFFARYVRHECVDGSHRYAFHFMNVKPKQTDLICRYVNSEQMKELKQSKN